MNSLLVVGLVEHWREPRHSLAWFMGIGAAAKILVEMNMGQVLLTQPAWPSVPSVHAVGFLSGLVLGYVIGIAGVILRRPQPPEAVKR